MRIAMEITVRGKVDETDRLAREQKPRRKAFR
jgi:hypothetical protein